MQVFGSFFGFREAISEMGADAVLVSVSGWKAPGAHPTNTTALHCQAHSTLLPGCQSTKCDLSSNNFGTFVLY